jgi:hypothetical protein
MIRKTQGEENLQRANLCSIKPPDTEVFERKADFRKEVLLRDQ